MSIVNGIEWLITWILMEYCSLKENTQIDLYDTRTMTLFFLYSPACYASETLNKWWLCNSFGHSLISLIRMSCTYNDIEEDTYRSYSGFISSHLYHVCDEHMYKHCRISIFRLNFSFICLLRIMSEKVIML